MARSFWKSAIAVAFLLLGMQASHAQSSNPFNPDFAWCATPGSIAVRNATPPLWGCLTPGTSGQVLRTNGPGANPGWQTVSGTGTVTSVGLAMPSFITVTGSPVTTSGTLTGTLASQTANTFLAAPNGSAGAPTFRAMVAADLPNAGVLTGDITGTFPTTTIGTNVILNTHVSPSAAIQYSKMQAIGPNSVLGNMTGSGAVASSQTVPTILDNVFSSSGNGYLKRTGALTYTSIATVPVADGGTGTGTASGTAVDNISGFSGTGLMRRTGAGTYTFGTQVATGEIADTSITTAKLATPAASGASMVLLCANSVSNAATLPLTGCFSSTYDVYKIELVNAVPSTNSVTLRFQFGNGGTYVTGANYSSGLACPNNNSTGAYSSFTSQTGAQVSGTVTNATSSGGVQLSATMIMPSDTSTVKRMFTNSNYLVTGGAAWWSCNGFGVYGSGTAAVTDLQFLFDAGNITGAAYVYGMRKS